VAADLASVNAENIVARTDGDEFALLLRGRSTIEAATSALKQYDELFRSPLRGHGVAGVSTIGASIGAARFPADGSTAEELMLRAHVALDVAKARGGSTAVMFEWPMERVLEEKRLRAIEVIEALAHDHFSLLYQPTFALATRQVTGAEALIRWNHPVRGQLPPAEFIGFAERHGMIGKLSRWVLARIVRDLSDSRRLPPGFRVYFNLSAQLLDDVPFIAELSESLRAAPDLIEHLGIEVTETGAMQNVERSMHTIDLMRSWGLSVAIDDFGTGYSSLSYLKQLTVDVVKIDRSFIAGLPDDERDAALTETLLDITTRLGFATLAEGIETEAQLSWLIAHGCKFGQGYLVAKPVPFSELLLRLGAPVAA
jgi:EAL domain-containing protein (putative c-di-GMP-specific phosphodiesterase class I)